MRISNPSNEGSETWWARLQVHSVQVTKVGEDSDLSLQQGGDAGTLLASVQSRFTVQPFESNQLCGRLQFLQPVQMIV